MKWLDRIKNVIRRRSISIEKQNNSQHISSQFLGGPVKIITPQELREEKEKEFREALEKLIK